MNDSEMFNYSDPSFSRHDERNEERNRKQEYNATEKRRLISAAQTFQYSTDWKSTSIQMKELMNSWKTLGNAGTDNDLLWSQFGMAQDSYWQRKKAS